ncbi:MAG: hypothetical protein LBJ47_10330 [Tannerella sp.]|jgi:hypothetical protein|nr:hypothetical protein [Tannerella sp.]
MVLSKLKYPSPAKVQADASDFLPQPAGRFPTRRISCRSLREGFLRVGFLAAACGKVIFVSDFMPQTCGKVSDASDFSSEIFRKVSDAPDFLPEIFGKVSDAPNFSPEPPGKNPTHTLRGMVIRDNSGMSHPVTGDDDTITKQQLQGCIPNCRIPSLRGTKQSMHRRSSGLHSLCLDCFAPLAMTGWGMPAMPGRGLAMPVDAVRNSWRAGLGIISSIHFIFITLIKSKAV